MAAGGAAAGGFDSTHLWLITEVNRGQEKTKRQAHFQLFIIQSWEGHKKHVLVTVYGQQHGIMSGKSQRGCGVSAALL